MKTGSNYIKLTRSEEKRVQVTHDWFWFYFGGLMASAFDSGASGPGSSPGRGQCVVFLGKTLYSHSASLHPGV